MKPLGVATGLCVALSAALAGATLPANFTEVSYTGLSNPTAMAIAADGRIFVCEQGGKLRIVKSGVLLSTPFVSLTVDSTGERGLLGVALDPNFATNHYVYALLHRAGLASPQSNEPLHGRRRRRRCDE